MSRVRTSCRRHASQDIFASVRRAPTAGNALRPAYRAVTVEVNQCERQGMPANNKNRFCDHCVVPVTREAANHKGLTHRHGLPFDQPLIPSLGFLVLTASRLV